MAFKSLHIFKSLATNVLQNQSFQPQHNAPYLPTPHKYNGYKQKKRECTKRHLNGSHWKEDQKNNGGRENCTHLNKELNDELEDVVVVLMQFILQHTLHFHHLLGSIMDWKESLTPVWVITTGLTNIIIPSLTLATVSKWILTSCQAAMVTPGWTNKFHHKSTGI